MEEMTESQMNDQARQALDGMSWDVQFSSDYAMSVNFRDMVNAGARNILRLKSDRSAATTWETGHA